MIRVVTENDISNKDITQVVNKRKELIKNAKLTLNKLATACRAMNNEVYGERFADDYARSVQINKYLKKYYDYAEQFSNDYDKYCASYYKDDSEGGKILDSLYSALVNMKTWEDKAKNIIIAIKQIE